MLPLSEVLHDVCNEATPMLMITKRHKKAMDLKVFIPKVEWVFRIACHSAWVVAVVSRCFNQDT
jgi:hypothetical protein